jgi:hypothetical protein
MKCPCKPSAILVVSALIAGCAAPTASPFHLEISDYNGAMAYGYEYHLGDDRFSVVWFGDLAGEQPKEVFASARSPEGRQQL